MKLNVLYFFKNCLNRVLKIESTLMTFYDTLNSIRGQIDNCFQQVKGALEEVQEMKTEISGNSASRNSSSSLVQNNALLSATGATATTVQLSLSCNNLNSQHYNQAALQSNQTSNAITSTLDSLDLDIENHEQYAPNNYHPNESFNSLIPQHQQQFISTSNNDDNNNSNGNTLQQQQLVYNTIQQQQHQLISSTSTLMPASSSSSPISTTINNLNQINDNNNYRYYQNLIVSRYWFF